MTDILKLTLSLTIVAVVAGVAIAFTHAKTADKIELRQQEVRAEALRAVFPEGVEIETQEGGSPLPDSFWVAKRDGETVGYAFQAAARGYSSTIEIMVGVSTDGEIMGLTVLSQNETPGLGTRVAEVVSDKYLWNGLGAPKGDEKPWFTEQFTGLDVTEDIEVSKTKEWHKASGEERGELRKKNTVTAITGATISTEAVISAVERDVSRYARALKDRTPEGEFGKPRSEVAGEAPEGAAAPEGTGTL